MGLQLDQTLHGLVRILAQATWVQLHIPVSPQINSEISWDLWYQYHAWCTSWPLQQKILWLRFSTLAGVGQLFPCSLEGHSSLWRKWPSFKVGLYETSLSEILYQLWRRFFFYWFFEEQGWDAWQIYWDVAESSGLLQRVRQCDRIWYFEWTRCW